jgi:hypothetical protein
MAKTAAPATRSVRRADRNVDFQTVAILVVMRVLVITDSVGRLRPTANLIKSRAEGPENLVKKPLN